ncbi:MAG: cysteine hydrolase [Clostridia bacterium]|nr:cysteine hydrolase [Clostridia bacterium]
MKILVVVDMQNDFIDGALGTKEAVSIVPAVKEKIESRKEEGYCVIFTRDTHTQDYLSTQEGKKLPVPHCIKNTPGWEITSQLDSSDCLIFDKVTFGSVDLMQYVSSLPSVEEIELVGLCTDICVISNAMLLKAALPEVSVSVCESCCAGVTPESHKNALEAMKMCQISII